MIILYSNDCPRCKILKQELDKNKIGYILVTDVELMLSKGFKIMPMLDIDGQVMNFAESLKWINKGENA